MPAFTVQEIVNRAAFQSDMHDDFVSPDAWLAWFNVEQRALELFCARKGWVIGPVTTTTVTNAPYTLTLPANSIGLIGVWEVDSSGRYRLLQHTDAVSFRKQDPITGPISGAAREYAVELSGDVMTVSLFPRPISGTYFALTIGTTPSVTTLSDSRTYPLGIEEWVVLRLARRALTKEESDTRPVERLLSVEEAKVEEVCWARALAETPTIRRRVNTEWMADLLYPEVARWVWL